MELYLIRHVQTVDNENRRYCGHRDSEISEQGYQQLTNLSSKMKEYQVETVYASPLKRTFETAKSFCEEPVLREGLKEINFGRFEGLTLEEIRELHPQEYNKFMVEGDHYIFPDGEGVISFFDRVNKELENIISLSKEKKKIAIVGHGGTIRAILSILISDSSRFYWNFRIDNGSISKVTLVDNFAVIYSLNE